MYAARGFRVSAESRAASNCTLSSFTTYKFFTSPSFDDIQSSSSPASKQFGFPNKPFSEYQVSPNKPTKRSSSSRVTNHNTSSTTKLTTITRRNQRHWPGHRDIHRLRRPEVPRHNRRPQPLQGRDRPQRRASQVRNPRHHLNHPTRRQRRRLHRRRGQKDRIRLWPSGRLNQPRTSGPPAK
jgi:hypothetical protein